MGVIRSIICHPSVYPHVGDDFSPSAADWMPVASDHIWYVLALEAEELLGMWIFIPENAICWNVHTCLLPSAYGDRAKAAAKGMAQWIWENTNCLRLNTMVPAYNRLALAFARKAGMEQFGVNPKSYMKNGILHDQILLGMSKPEALCQS